MFEADCCCDQIFSWRGECPWEGSGSTWRQRSCMASTPLAHSAAARCISPSKAVRSSACCARSCSTCFDTCAHHSFSYVINLVEKRCQHSGTLNPGVKGFGCTLSKVHFRCAQIIYLEQVLHMWFGAKHMVHVWHTCNDAGAPAVIDPCTANHPTAGNPFCISHARNCGDYAS
jgi:hypothetical protein